MKKRIFILIIVFLSTLFIIGKNVFAQESCTLYVATDGSDNNAGTNSDPFRTIQKAFNSAQVGNTICIKSGEYYENVKGNGKDGQSGNYITIRSLSGNPKDVTVNGGEDRSDPGQWTRHSGEIYYTTGIGWSTGNVVQDDVALGPGQIRNKNRCEGSLSGLGQGECYQDRGADRLYVWAFGGGNPGQYKMGIGRGFVFDFKSSSYIRLKGLTIKNGFNKNGGAGVQPGPHNIIEDSILYHNRWGVKAFSSQTDTQILNNEMYNNGDGIIFWDTDNWVIRGNILHNNYDDGADGLEGPQNCLIENNIIHDNGEDGIKLGDRGRQAKNCIVRNNLAYNQGSGNYKIDGIGHKAYHNTGSKGFFEIEGSNHDIRNNIMQGSSYLMSNSGPITFENNIDRNTDAQFVDPSNGDFHLKSNSPAIDAGVDLGINVDLDGNTRPQGNGYDAGAYEFGSSGSVLPTVSLTANPLSINEGESSTLTWFTTNTDSCMASGGWSGTKAVSGSEKVFPATTTSYTLNCAGNEGTTSKSTTVTVSRTQPPSSQFLKYFEAESGTIISSFHISNDVAASSGSYLTTPSGISILNKGKTEASTPVAIPGTGQYYLWARVFGPASDKDALYVGFDGIFNRVYPSITNTYEWIKVGSVYNLNSGTNQITIGHAEPEARIDVLALTNDSNFVPRGMPTLPGSESTPGDINGDKKVDLLDILMIINDFGKTSGFDERVDVNKDNIINILDILEVIKNWETTS